jgi:hypothetical protein
MVSGARSAPLTAAKTCRYEVVAEIESKGGVKSNDAVPNQKGHREVVLFSRT